MAMVLTVMLTLILSLNRHLISSKNPVVWTLIYKLPARKTKLTGIDSAIELLKTHRKPIELALVLLSRLNLRHRDYLGRRYLGYKLPVLTTPNKIDYRTIVLFPKCQQSPRSCVVAK
jgi:hypothetical protein